MRRGAAIALFWVASTGFAAESDQGAPVELDIHADLKSFFVGSFPYDHLIMPDEPSATGIVDLRGKVDLDAGDPFRLEVHHAVTGTTAAFAGMGLGTGTGVGLQAPEAVELGWTAVDESGMTVQGRTDRLVVKSTMGATRLAIGRQSITLGAGQFFTPLDLVNPFHPATVDTEYKPGIDAVRVDAYPSDVSEITVVAAYAGDWKPADMVFAAYGQTQVGTASVGLMLGEIHGDEVVGVSSIFEAGAVGMVVDATFTLPDDEEDDPFVRAVLGATHRPTATTTIGLEAYHQGNGASNPGDYLEQATDERYARGELWALGQWYGGVSVLQEITPLVHGSLATVANLADGSALLLPSVNVSVSDDAVVAAGAFIGLGERPAEIDVFDLLTGDFGAQSEFGLYPTTVFVQTKAYF